MLVSILLSLSYEQELLQHTFIGKFKKTKILFDNSILINKSFNQIEKYKQ